MGSKLHPDSSYQRIPSTQRKSCQLLQGESELRPVLSCKKVIICLIQGPYFITNKFIQSKESVRIQMVNVKQIHRFQNHRRCLCLNTLCYPGVICIYFIDCSTLQPFFSLYLFFFFFLFGHFNQLIQKHGLIKETRITRVKYKLLCPLLN